MTEAERDWWHDSIKKAIGYVSIDDFYEMTVIILKHSNKIIF